MNANELEDRFIDFSVKIITLSRILERTYAGKQLSNQITRASISSALNYGEVRFAESKKDFIHKIKIVRKELKEINVGLKICFRSLMLKRELNSALFQECEELVAIFVKTSLTASNQLKIKNPK